MDNTELVVGIDLGTTNSCISVIKNNRAEVIPNSEGNRTTLSYVFYGKRDILVGKTAKHEASSKPTNGIYEIKRILGCLHDDPEIDREKNSLTYNLIRGSNGEIKIQIDQEDKKVEIFPEEICGRILHKLKKDAEDFLGKKISKAVITVPAYFNNNQRAATRDSAKIAGLEVVKLINEPSAAALAYVHENKFNEEKIILIYDLGGGTFDVSIIKSANGNITVLSVAGNTHLGGQDFLNNLVEYVVEKIEEKNIQIRNNKRWMWNILNLCERTKKILTTSKRTTISPDFLPEFQLEITREKFDEINEDLFKQTINIVNSCMKNIQLDKCEIDQILLVGGSSRIPKIEDILRDFFKKPIRRNINPDEAIAIGAAIEADFFTQFQKSLLIDILPLSIGTVFDEETIFFNFTKNTKLPAISKFHYRIKNAKKKNCILSVYEGEYSDCAKNVLLGAHEIKFLKSVKGKTVEITMQINNDGIIWITAKGDTIKTFSIALNKGRLEDEEISKINQEMYNERP